MYSRGEKLRIRPEFLFGGQYHDEFLVWSGALHFDENIALHVLAGLHEKLQRGIWYHSAFAPSRAVAKLTCIVLKHSVSAALRIWGIRATIHAMRG